jgi:hypothetical protein
MAMASGPRDRGHAARDEPGARVRTPPRACLLSVQHRRPLWAVLGVLLGALSLLPTTGRRHAPAGLCATRPPDAWPAASCPFLLVLLRGSPGLLPVCTTVSWRLASSRPDPIITIGYAPRHTLQWSCLNGMRVHQRCGGTTPGGGGGGVPGGGGGGVPGGGEGGID